ncbi:MAG: DUF1553 domain-containing protein, partial [Pseudomonadota bacterium]
MSGSPGPHTAPRKRAIPGPKRRPPHDHPERGSALILVLWTALFLSLLLAGALATARIETRLAAAGVEEIHAKAAARAALNWAAHELATGPRDRTALAQVRSFQWGDYSVTIDVEDEAGKIDLNVADKNLLAALLQAAGAAPALAEANAERVIARRERNAIGRKERPFIHPAELAGVVGGAPPKHNCLTSATTVAARTPRMLHEKQADLPDNRLGLAQWIVDRENPLTARVTVNR